MDGDGLLALVARDIAAEVLHPAVTVHGFHLV